MTDELVFYTNPMSRGRIVRWMLEEVGQPYRTELLEYGTTMKAPDYLAINPMGKVPALRHGDTVVTECPAICCYLADAFAAAGLAPPAKDRRRGPYYRWMFFAAGPLEAATTNQAFGLEVPAQRKGMVGYGSLAEVLSVLEAALSEREYLVGERFTGADVYVGSHIGWGMMFGTIDKRPAFEGYFERISTRPAAVRRAPSTTPSFRDKSKRHPDSIRRASSAAERAANWSELATRARLPIGAGGEADSAPQRT